MERGAAVSANRSGECPPMRATSPVRAAPVKSPARAWDNTRLVAECLRGNEQAWSLLIDKYKALIYSIPVKYRLPPHEAADVFQATCAELLVRLPQLRDPEALPKWLMQVAHARRADAARCDEHLIATMPSIGRIAFLRDARASLRPSGQGTGTGSRINRIHPPKMHRPPAPPAR